MAAIAFPRPRDFDRLDAAWAVLALASLATMVAFPSWETIPFHVIWISLTLLYGFRVWSLPTTSAILAAVMAATGASIFADAFDGLQLWGELFEVPLMAAMFVAMVWHARRRVQALERAEALADERASLLEQQERLVQNVSHELRTPVTIARGHLELLQRELGGEQAPLNIALEELQRIEVIVDRVLLLARTEQPEQVVRTTIELTPFLEDVFLRWSEVAQRGWRLGPTVDVTIDADETWLRTALDALIENAVQHTAEYGRIELSARLDAAGVTIAVADDGQGIAPWLQERIFERFSQAGNARSRHAGGAGLGLSIAAAIARAHGGSCTVDSVEGSGSTFELRLPHRQTVDLPAAASHGPQRLAPAEAGG